MIVAQYPAQRRGSPVRWVPRATQTCATPLRHRPLKMIVSASHVPVNNTTHTTAPFGPQGVEPGQQRQLRARAPGDIPCCPSLCAGNQSFRQYQRIGRCRANGDLSGTKHFTRSIQIGVPDGLSPLTPAKMPQPFDPYEAVRQNVLLPF